MRVLVIGGTGLLGKALVEEWHSDEVVSTGFAETDIRNAAQVAHLVARCRPQWTLMLAAYTDVDGCESNPQLAHEVNCAGAATVAKAAAQCGSRLLLVSTDYVFDGVKGTPYEIDDPVNPISVYGRSKAEAEARVREILPDCCIVRSSWLFGTAGKCFPNTILQLAETRKELTVVNDQVGRPTYNRDLAHVLVQLVRCGARGTIHAANSGQCSWFEFAQEIVRLAGLRNVTVKPVSSDEFKRPAARPRYSVLSFSSLQPYGIVLRDWREALRAYFEERAGTVVQLRESATSNQDNGVVDAGNTSGRKS